MLSNIETKLPSAVTVNLITQFHSITISGSGVPAPDDNRPPSPIPEEDLPLVKMIMDSMETLPATAMADHNPLSLNFDLFRNSECGLPPIPITMIDRQNDDLNTPVTSSEVPSFFATAEPLDPPPITGNTNEKNIQKL